MSGPRRTWLRLRSMAVLAAMLVTAPATAQTSSGSSNNGLASVLSGTPSTSSFSSLIGTVSDVINQLQNQPNITVFVPSNDALASLSQDPTLQSQLSNSQFLEAALLYHALDQTVSSEQFAVTPDFAHTLLNSSTYTNVTGGQVLELQRSGSDLLVTSGLRRTAKIVQADIPIANGVIHVIDSLLQLPLSVTSTSTAANLTSFAGGLSISSLSTTLDTISDITVFAPSNAAFENIANIASRLTVAELHELLAYHVVPGAQGYSSLLTNTTDVPTLAGPHHTVYVTVVDGAVFVNAARIILADVLLSDGVLHVIDAVLNPNATGPETPDFAATKAPVLFSAATAASSQLPFTSGQPIPTTINSAFSSTTDRVVFGYSTMPTRAIQTSTMTSASSTGGVEAPPVTRATGLAQVALVGGVIGMIVLS